MINIVIPMAGNGQRFVDAGFKTSKPRIDVNGVPMINRVIENLTPRRHDFRFIFLCRPEDYDYMSQFGEVIEIAEQTGGAACTAMHARDIIDNAEPVVIASCDQVVDFDMDDFLDKAHNTAGMVITYKSDKDHHSFCRTEKGYVKEVAEKKVISDNANVGIYYFGTGRDFCASAEAMLDAKDTFNDEYYLAPVYNYLLKEGKKNIRLYEVEEDACHILGTPRELRRYLEC